MVCSGTNHNPHYSPRAGGTIFKTTITCTGSGSPPPAVYVYYAGVQRFAPSIGCYTGNLQWQTRGDSSYGQWVPLNDPTTFYTPRTGHGGEGLGWWGASTTWYFYLNGVRSTTGSHVIYKCLDNRP